MLISKIKEWYRDLIAKELLSDDNPDAELIVRSYKVHPSSKGPTDYITTAVVDASIWWWGEFESLLGSEPIMDEFSYKRIVGDTKREWLKAVRLAMTDYDQMHPIVVTYQDLRDIYISKADSPDIEWRDFCSWVEQLPCSETIIKETDYSMRVGETITIQTADGLLNIQLDKEFPFNQDVRGFGNDILPTLVSPRMEYYDGAENEHLILLYDKVRAVDPCFRVYMIFIADYIDTPRLYEGVCEITNLQE